MMSHTTLSGMLHLMALVAGLWMIQGNLPPAIRGNPMRLSVVLSIAMGGWLMWISEPHPPFEDFIDAYYAAGRAVLQGGPQALRPVIEMGVSGFVNLPILAYLFAPFGILSPSAAAILFAIAGGVGAVWSWWLLVRLAHLDQRQAAVLLFLFAANGPLANSLKEGNTSHFILLLFVLALTWIEQRRDIRAGIALGVAAIVKPPLLLIGVYFLVRRRWRVVAGGAMACAVLVGLSLALFGVEFHRLWYVLCIEPFSRDPMAAFNVQSIQAFVLRFQTGMDGLFNWSPVPFEASYGVASRALVAGLFLLVGWLLFRRSVSAAACERSAQLVPVEFLIVVALILATSPISWSHYYTWCLLPFGFFLSNREGAWDRPVLRRGGWLGVALVSAPVVAVEYAAGWTRMPYMQIATSGLMLGGLLYLFMLGWVRNQVRGPL